MGKLRVSARSLSGKTLALDELLRLKSRCAQAHYRLQATDAIGSGRSKRGTCGGVGFLSRKHIPKQRYAELQPHEAELFERAFSE